MGKLDNTFLGIELGSTRIKAVLIDEGHGVIASASHTWENSFENGYWTYSLEEAWEGLRACFRALSDSCGGPITTVKAMGVSAMMHGYLVFGSAGKQLVPFRTWRNTTAGQAAEELTELLGFGIPRRWSIAHLRQAMLDNEAHVKEIAYMTTLAGYVHWRLTGEKVLGVGDASGMFPIDSEINDYHEGMLKQFKSHTQRDLRKILPAVRVAGEPAGRLSPEGALLLDPTGHLKPGIPLCPPEGDAGTGMVATNAVTLRSGNVSAGTSIFAMAVLESAPARALPGIDIVTTPAGRPVAMVHCNNCTSDIDAWAHFIGEALGRFGAQVSLSDLYDSLYAAALEGEPDCGGVLSYNFVAAEPAAGVAKGCPLLCRGPGARLTPENLMRSLLFSAVAGLRLGMDVLAREGIGLERVTGHGGFFKSGTAGQRLLAAALDTPVTVMACAGEGGSWGMALLAAYMEQKKAGEPLEGYLADRVFAGAADSCVAPCDEDRQGFARYFERYKAGLAGVDGLAGAA
ncbi:MAG: FGGY-family carbohydrate kinase [Oscillospiraceae bacterium]|nr:FGGY-family carbohydrate kinase [Oscillospiraceae bacterium]